MATNLSALASVSNKAIGLSNLIIATPEDKGILPEFKTQQQGTAKRFLFDFYGENKVTLQSEITDHFIEDNTPLQDHIALRPEIIRGHGFIGELGDFIPEEPPLLREARDKLTILSAYTPEISVSAILAYNAAFQAYQVAKLAASSVVSRWNSLKASGVETLGNALFFSEQHNKQQAAFRMFYGYYKQRILFTVQTPWAVFQHCAIELIDFNQSPETNMITDVQVSFKPIRYASTKVTDEFGNQIVGGDIVNADAASVTNLGSGAGSAVPETQADLFGRIYG